MKKPKSGQTHYCMYALYMLKSQYLILRAIIIILVSVLPL